MSLPVVAHPLGWVVLGATGYLTYKAGKKAGIKDEEDITKISLSDRVVKKAMKAAYKTQKSVCQGMSKAKEKYRTLWAEARTESNETSN